CWRSVSCAAHHLHVLRAGTADACVPRPPATGAEPAADRDRADTKPTKAEDRAVRAGSFGCALVESGAGARQDVVLATADTNETPMIRARDPSPEAYPSPSSAPPREPIAERGR